MKRKFAAKKMFAYIYYIFMVVLIGCALLTTPSKGTGPSNRPTFQKDDISIGIRNVSNIERGDFVGISEEWFDGCRKRVVGLPGETVEYKDGILYINGEALDEPYIDNSMSKLHDIDGERCVLKEDEYYILGDNRGNSSDSRIYGPVQKKYIEYKLLKTEDGEPVRLRKEEGLLFVYKYVKGMLIASKESVVSFFK